MCIDTYTPRARHTVNAVLATIRPTDFSCEFCSFCKLYCWATVSVQRGSDKNNVAWCERIYHKTEEPTNVSWVFYIPNRNEMLIFSVLSLCEVESLFHSYVVFRYFFWFLVFSFLVLSHSPTMSIVDIATIARITATVTLKDFYFSIPILFMVFPLAHSHQPTPSLVCNVIRSRLFYLLLLNANVPLVWVK